MKRFLFAPYFWIAPITLWTLLFALSLLWNHRSLDQHAIEMATNRGQFIFNMVQTFRVWNARHGGVYAPITDQNLPNPYLKVKEREITTPLGVELTKINPAYMTRQVAGISRELSGLTIHITSLTPLNPINKADAWEQKVLKLFELGVQASHSIEHRESVKIFRFMAPLVTREACLKCHAIQGYEVGDIRGGISVSFPVDEFISHVEVQKSNILMMHVGVWLLLSALTLLFLKYIRHQMLLLQSEKMQREELVHQRTRELKEEIHERKQTAHALKLSQERFRSVAQSAGDAIISADHKGHIIFWNRAAGRLFGYQESEALQKPLTLIIPQPLQQSHSAAFNTVVDTGHLRLSDQVVELTALHKEGHELAIELSLASWRASDGQIFFSAVIRDISERKRTEAELAHAKESAEGANRAKTAFLATMSHEIRTPINAILGMGELLLETKLDGEQRKFLETSNQASESLLSLINDILDLSKIEAGQLDLERIAFDLSSLVEGSIDILRLMAEEKALELSVQIDTGIPQQVIGDPARLRQVLINLISNAIKFTMQGRIDVALHADGDRVQVMVRDTGIGIDKEKQETIFLPFNQGDASSTRAYGGSGLGLTICRQLIENMGGKIWLESQPGEGSTFHFTVPLPDAEGFRGDSHNMIPPGVEMTSARERSARDRALRILVADDSPDNILLIRAFLKKTAYQVEVATNGREAVEHFIADPFDCVLMDIQMPVMDGYEATRRIRAWEQEQTRTHVPIIALTAHAMLEVGQKVLEAGCNIHLTKPVKKARLMEVIRSLTYRANL